MKSNFLIDNIEKVILVILIIVLLVLIVTYTGGSYLRQTNVQNRLVAVQFSNPPKVIKGLDEYKKVLTSLQKKRKFSIYENQFRRDGFCKYVELLPPKPLFKLKSVKRLPLEIKYKGFIKYTGGVLGQINLKGKTYFVREDGKLADYKILKLTTRYALIENIKGNKIKLPLREQVLSDEYEATIYLTPEDKIGSLKFQVGEFEKQKKSAEGLVNAILKDSGEKQQEFSAPEKAIDWLNNSILPYKFLNISELTPEIEKLSVEIDQNKGKKLSEFTDEELKNMAKTIEGIRLKRLILEQKYPLKTPKSHRITKVKKGDKIKNFQILDILPDYVVLLNKATSRKEVLK